MVKTIKLRDNDKIRLDQLRAELLLSGVNLNQEEFLSKLLDLAEKNLSTFKEFSFKELTPEKKAEILARGFKMGITSEESVDRDIYGV
jgi:hypothetical protein